MQQHKAFVLKAIPNTSPSYGKAQFNHLHAQMIPHGTHKLVTHAEPPNHGTQGTQLVQSQLRIICKILQNE
jgi:hypothetical protein